MKKPNIVLITIDCLRGDFVNEENTPNLLRLVDKYNGFITTKAYTAGMATPHAFRSILGGIYPLKYGPKIGAPEEVPMLAEVLKKAGYTTIGINAGNPYVSSLAGYNRGFDIFNDYLHSKKSFKTSKYKKFLRGLIGEKTYSELSKVKKALRVFRYGNPTPYLMANNIISNAEKIVSKLSSPFFLWIHLMDVHEPYLTERTFLTFKERIDRTKVERIIWNVTDDVLKYLNENLINFSETNIFKIVEMTSSISDLASQIKKLYISSIKSMDLRIAEFTEALINNNPNSYFIITSDHGQGLFEYKIHGHYQFFHNNTLIKIPLILLSKNSFALPTNSNSTISNIDIGPTICDLTNIEQPRQWDGMSLFRNRNVERVIFTQSLFPNLPAHIVRGKVKHFSAFLISAHNILKGSTSVIDNKKAMYGSYSSTYLEEKALNFATQTIKRMILLEKMREITESM